MKKIMLASIVSGYCLCFTVASGEEKNQKTPLTETGSWSIDFDNNTVGEYLKNQFDSDWSEPKWRMGRNLIQVVNNDDAFAGNSLKIKYPKGSSGCNSQQSCVLWPVDLGIKTDKLYYGFRFKFSKDFDFIKGGKLPGLSGGKANSGGNKPNGKDGWSVRLMWNEDGELVQYVYHPDQPEKYGEGFLWNMKEKIERGKWHTIQTMVQLNKLGKKNGRIISWINGKKVFQKDDFRFRDVMGLEIDHFQFVSFYGGHGPDWAPHKDEYIYFDDIRISRTAPFFTDESEITLLILPPTKIKLMQ